MMRKLLLIAAISLILISNVDLTAAKPVITGGKVKAAPTPPPPSSSSETVNRNSAKKRLSQADIVTEWSTYRRRFEEQRALQTRTLEKLVKTTKHSFPNPIDRLSAQTRVLEQTLVRLIDELASAKTMILEAGDRMTMTDPGSIQTVVSVWENTAFAGDMVVLMDKAAIPLIKANKTMLEVLAWSTDFSKNFFIGPDLVQLERVRDDLDLKEITMELRLSEDYFKALKESMVPQGPKSKKVKTKTKKARKSEL